MDKHRMKHISQKMEKTKHDVFLTDFRGGREDGYLTRSCLPSCYEQEPGYNWNHCCTYPGAALVCHCHWQAHSGVAGGRPMTLGTRRLLSAAESRPNTAQIHAKFLPLLASLLGNKPRSAAKHQLSVISSCWQSSGQEGRCDGPLKGPAGPNV